MDKSPGDIFRNHMIDRIISVMVLTAVVTIVMILPGVRSEIMISEVMPNPPGDDKAMAPAGEWVELYNTADIPLDLKGYKITDSKDDNEIYITDTTAGGNTTIRGENFLVVYANKDSDFSLNNHGYEEVRLFNNKTIISSMSYSDAVEGMSISKIGKLWINTPPTPGKKNKGKEGCDWKIQIAAGKGVFNRSASFELMVKKVYGYNSIINVRGHIEDIFGNIIKEYSPFTNESITMEKKKSYSPRLKEGTYRLVFFLDSVDCEDTSPENNIANEIISINPRYRLNTPHIDIEKIYLGRDKKARWGDDIRVRLKIYKGKTKRYSIQIYASDDDKKRVSKTTRLNIYDMYKDYDLTVPLSLIDNCNGKYEEGKYKIIVKGLGLLEEKKIKIADSKKGLCKKQDTVRKRYPSLKVVSSGIPARAYIGSPDPVRINVTFSNQRETKQKVQVWSYIYRGRKVYSGYKEKNKEEYIIDKKDNLTITQEIFPDKEISAGEYKVKIYMLKEGRKHPDDITEKIDMVPGSKGISSNCKNTLLKGHISNTKDKENSLKKYAAQDIKLQPDGGHINRGGRVIYKNKDRKISDMFPAGIVLTYLLFTIGLIFKKI